MGSPRSDSRAPAAPHKDSPGRHSEQGSVNTPVPVAVLVMFLVILALSFGCGGGPGQTFAAAWTAERLNVEDQGITMRLLHFDRFRGGEALIVFYALYDETDDHLIPAEAVITDDTGKLHSNGRVVPLVQFRGVNFGAIAFDSPLFESSLVDFEMTEVQRSRTAGSDSEAISGDWTLPGFMRKILKGQRCRGCEWYYSISDVPGSHDLRDITVAHVGTVGVYEPGHRLYEQWRIEAKDGELAQLFFTVSPKGEARQVASEDYERARESLDR